MREEEPKTGRFNVRQALRPGLSEMHKDYARRQAFQQLGWRLGKTLQDGREYCVRCYVDEWDDDEGVLGPYEVLVVWYDVSLWSWREAEVGEHVKDLAHHVSPQDEFHSEDGRVFQRMPYGWQRIS